MKHQLIDRVYSVFSKEIPKEQSLFSSVDEIETHLKERIDTHPVAGYITTFDHYTHTASLDNGRIPAHIKASINVLFCFGIAIPSPEYMAVKPMSIAVVETENSFVLSFEQAPAPSLNRIMQSWIEEILRL